MNAPNFGRLLVLGQTRRQTAPNPFRLAKTPSARGPSFMAVREVSLAPVHPLLSTEREGRHSAGRSRRGTGFLAGGLALVAASFLMLMLSGFQRVDHARERYQLSNQIQRRERELKQVQRAYHALAAYVAVQKVNDAQVLAQQNSTAKPVKIKTKG
jgi:hypothetical protein